MKVVLTCAGRDSLVNSGLFTFETLSLSERETGAPFKEITRRERIVIRKSDNKKVGKLITYTDYNPELILE